MTFSVLSRGDIVLTRLPFTDLTSSSVRPGLIISVEQFGQDVILAAISSVIRDNKQITDYVVNISHPEFLDTGLRVPSVLRLYKLATIERPLIIRRLGYIGPQLQAEVDKILCVIFGL